MSRGFGNRMGTVGSRLREVRENLSINQTDMAALGGVTKKTLGLYERDERSPTAEFFEKLHRADINIYYVLTGNQTVPSLDFLAKDERTLLEDYRLFTDEEKQSFLTISRAMCGRKSNI